jgi:hypothetical protein
MTTELLAGLPLAQLPDLERQAEEFERKAQAIRQLIDAVRTLNGEATEILFHKTFESHRAIFEIAPLAKGGPRGPQAVLRVMREKPDDVWKVVELKREMLRRGWAPTPKAVEASVRKLRELGEVLPAGYGHYRLAPCAFKSPASTRAGSEDDDEH